MELTHIHKALSDAKWEGIQEKSRTITFRIDAKLAEMTEEICQRNGTTLSKFFRHCAIGLVRDYHTGQ